MTRFPRFGLFPIRETLLLSLVALFLVSNPLLESFSFEFSWIMGVAAFLIHAMGSALRLTSWEHSQPVNHANIRRLALSNLISLIVPIFILGVFSDSHATCRWFTGLLWYLLFPVVSSFFGTACATWAVYRNRHFRHPILWTLIPFFLFSILTVYDLWNGPALFFFNPAFGYYPGPLFDEWIPLEPRVIGFRIWTLGLAIFLFWPKHQQTSIRTFFGLLLMVLFLFRGMWGWSSNPYQLENTLGGTLETSHIKLHFDSKKNTVKELQPFLFVLHARAHEVSEHLLLSSDEVKPVDVYLYSSVEQKRLLTGTQHTLIGNPITRSLHLLDMNSRSTIIPHELTHVLASPYGLPGLGLSFRVGLLEGLATSQEKYRGKLSLHEWAKAMRLLKRLPSLGQVMGFLSFYQQPPSRAYMASGSFCRWLIRERGMKSLLRVYRGESFSSVYGADLQTLEEQWHLFLENIPLSTNALDYAKPVLQRKAIFKRQCPHDVAHALFQAKQCWQEQKPQQSVSWLNRAHTWSGKSPQTARTLARTLGDLGQWDKSWDLVQNLPSSAQNDLQKGDVLFMRGNLPGAQKAYEKGLLRAFSDLTKLQLHIRLDLLEASSKELLRPFIQEERFCEAVQNLEPQSQTDAMRVFCVWTALREKNMSFLVRADAWLHVNKNSPWYALAQKIRARVHESLGHLEAAQHTYQRLFSISETDGERLFAKDQFFRLERMKKLSL